MNWIITILLWGEQTAGAGDTDSHQGFPMLGNYLVLLGVALIILVLWTNIRRRVRLQDNLDPRERIERSKEVNSMKNDLRTMMVELDDLTRRFGAQLDAKSLKLERLIEQADKRIAKLGGSAESDPSPRVSQSDEITSRSATASDPPPDPLAENVYRLADAGKGSGDIARELDEHIGKVELILALRQS